MILRWAVKVANSAGLLLITALIVVSTSTILYSILENKSATASFWWTIVTATTVGYGDTYPTHTAGRAVAIGLILFMVFAYIPTVTASIAAKLIVNHDAFTNDEQEELKADMRLAVSELRKTMAIIDPNGDGKLG